LVFPGAFENYWEFQKMCILLINFFEKLNEHNFDKPILL